MTRNVVCNMEKGSKNIVTVSDAECPIDKPESQKSCTDTSDCKWQVGKWSKCINTITQPV